MPYVVEPMKLEDIPQVTEIERESFPSFWPPNAYRRELLENKIARYIVAKEKREEGESSRLLEPQRLSPEGRSAPQPADKIERWFFGLKRLLSPEPKPPAINGPLIVGFAGLWFMVDEAHLTTIAVREAYRRRGIGELLLIATIDLATERGARVMTLEVRVSNIVAQSLYQKYGFSKVGLRPGYYTDTKEDALLMTTDNITTATFQKNLQALKQAHAERWELTPR